MHGKAKYHQDEEDFIARDALWRLVWYRLLKNALSVFGLIVVGFYLLFMLISPFLPLNPYQQTAPSHRNLPPPDGTAPARKFMKMKKRLCRNRRQKKIVP